MMHSTARRNGGYRRLGMGLLVLLSVVLAACSASPMPREQAPKNGASNAAANGDGNDEIDVTRQTTQREASPGDVQRLLRPRDRVLFMGDDLTQQGFYGRGVASALLSMFPDQRWRFFQGGRDGATAESALEWADDLLGLTRPQVVFICFGFNEGRTQEPLGDQVRKFRNGLDKLVKKVQGYKGVRRVVVLSPPPADTKLTRPAKPLGQNEALAALTIEAWKVAEARKVGFVNIFEYTRLAYISANRAGGAPLTIAGANPLPTGGGHAIIASVILKGMGVTREQLNPVGWTPMPRRRMYRVRQAMAIPLDAATVEKADRSYDLFLLITKHDTAFFRAWRLSGLKPSAPPRDQAMAKADLLWSDVLAVALSSYGDRTTDPSNIIHQPGEEVPPMRPDARPDEEPEEGDGEAS
jgi:hypothetical protein